jgi:hypothetical protein
MASCLKALKQKYPDVTIDIAAPSAAREVLHLLSRCGELLTYPLEAERMGAYHYYLCFEEVEAVPRGWRRSCADVFSACLHLPRPSQPADVMIPPDVQERWTLRSEGRPRAAIHVGGRANPRSYPYDLVESLAGALVDANFEAYLIGTAGGGGRLEHFPFWCSMPRVAAGPCASRGLPKTFPPTTSATGSGRYTETENATKTLPDHVRDLIGQTPTVADLAAVLAQMELVVTGDSFPMHLAGALRVPTIALFTATDPVLGKDYASVAAVQSSAGCSPCYVADGACPLGHAECIAHRAPPLAPRALVQRALSMLPVGAA